MKPSEFVKLLRHKRGLSLNRFSWAVRVSKTQIAAVESGKVKRPIVFLTKMKPYLSREEQYLCDEVIKELVK